ncbi:Fic family protein [Pseudaestuariivita rosea]|uniref:Fic family protein n=1 Tax=Pseudaestuariivita rosea TaxID=2763263 RepID=UPI001ABBD2D0|nr:Fic family protein [Pseudaestuariivita rosea]
MAEDPQIRHSQAEDAKLIQNSLERAQREASNAIKQAERVRQYILEVVDGRQFKLRPSKLLDLNRCAIEGLDPYAGVWRPAGIAIGESKHTPPDGHLVPELIEELCDYVNDNWEEKSAVHLASITMWRLNWIHPFTDGNGRTSRAASYLVLCAKEKTLFRGINTIPEQILEKRNSYYEALEKADATFENEGKFTDNVVIEMEQLISAMLAKQLRSAFENATSS